MRPGECDKAVEEWGECDEVAGERFGEQLGIHGNSVIGMESQGMVWIVDAEHGDGDAGREDGVSAVSQHPDKDSVSNTEDGAQDWSSWGLTLNIEYKIWSASFLSLLCSFNCLLIRRAVFVAALKLRI